MQITVKCIQIDEIDNSILPEMPELITRSGNSAFIPVKIARCFIRYERIVKLLLIETDIYCNLLDCNFDLSRRRHATLSRK